MAQFTDLPVELILEICSHLRPDRAAHRLFNITDDSKLARILLPMWKDLLHLSLTSRQMEPIVSRVLYRNISVHGNSSIIKLISLIRLLVASPEIAASVRHVYLSLSPLKTGIKSITPDDIVFIEKAGNKVGIKHIESLWEERDDEEFWWHNHPHQSGDAAHRRQATECKRLAVLLKIFLSYTKNIMSLAVEHSFQMLGSYRFDRDTKQAVEDDCCESLLPCLRLSSIATRSISDDWRWSWSHSSPPQSHNIDNVLRMIPNITQLLCNTRSMHLASQNFAVLHSVTHLTLSNVEVMDSELREFLSNCGKLTTFKYLPNCYDEGVSLPGIIEALRQHAGTLRTLCLEAPYEMTPVKDEKPLGLSVAGLTNLENFWIFVHGSRRPTHPNPPLRDGPSWTALDHFPPSLKRLHLRHEQLNRQDLLRLFENQSMLPNLQRVELAGTKHGFSDLEWFRKAFVQRGIESPPERTVKSKSAEKWDIEF